MATTPAGRLTRLVHPDGFVVGYGYDPTGAVTEVRENPDTANLLLAGYTYDALGRRTGIARGNGASTAYTYDPVGRLASLGHDLGGTSADVTFTYGYNPAGQIVSRTGSNDDYAYAVTANADVTDTHNGLNQIAATGCS